MLVQSGSYAPIASQIFASPLKQLFRLNKHAKIQGFHRNFIVKRIKKSVWRDEILNQTKIQTFSCFQSLKVYEKLPMIIEEYWDIQTLATTFFIRTHSSLPIKPSVQAPSTGKLSTQRMPMELQGVEPWTFRMRSGRSTN